MIQLPVLMLLPLTYQLRPQYLLLPYPPLLPLPHLLLLLQYLALQWLFLPFLLFLSLFPHSITPVLSLIAIANFQVPLVQALLLLAKANSAAMAIQPRLLN